MIPHYLQVVTALASNAVERLSAGLDKLQQTQPHIHLTSLNLLEDHLRRSLIRRGLISCNKAIGEGKGDLHIGRVAFSLWFSDCVYDSSDCQQ